MMAISVIIIIMLYLLFWQYKGGDFVVDFLCDAFSMERDSALNIYQRVFRNNIQIFEMVAVVVVFLVLFRFFLTWFTKYFNEINHGINALLDETGENIVLLPELSATEKKLNEVRQTLEKRKLEIKLSDQRKNDLVMYLAHDIKTPLTSVIGYLNLLDETPDMPTEQKAKYVHITLEKANRLEELINEFFEITRYNFDQIKIEKETIDLYYMLVQLVEEFYPILSTNKNTARLIADENLTLNGDPTKLARVFNNMLKNAATYSLPNTEISISAKQQNNMLLITFENKCKTIGSQELSTIFERFYRLDEARASNTGGSGLGLAIAKEIITLHGGTITAQSKNDTVTFTILLPIAD